MVRRRSGLLTHVLFLLLGITTAIPDHSGLASETFSSNDDLQTRIFPVTNDIKSVQPRPALREGGTDDQEALQELLTVLEEETEVATKTKMNNDYVPGMVTVLHGEQLQALGIQTVVEALSLVPGVEISRIGTGEPSVKVRGITYPFNAGNIKVMLNSIALSRESSGLNSSVLLTPIAQVDRIEVIRGPGSSIYGDFAMAGVVNIITKDTGGRLFMQAGDDGSNGVGGQYRYQDPKNSFDLGFNVSGIDDGDSATTLEFNPDEERYLHVFTLGYRSFRFTLEGVRRDLEFNGPPPAPIQPNNLPRPSPETDGSNLSQQENSWVMEGRQTIELDQASLELHLSYLNNSLDMDLPPRDFDGDRVEGGLDATWSPWSSHKFLLGLSYARSEIDRATDTGLSPQGTTALEIDGVTRYNYSAGIQDIISLSDRFSLTLGMRYDNYDDVGDNLTPRIAGVCRVGEHHVIKAQYSEGFRAPTFWELYRSGRSDDTLDFEKIKTWELAYIYRQPKAVGRMTLYHSKIANGLFAPPSTGIFTNQSTIESQGVEMEWEQQLNDSLRWQANLSYIDNSDDRWNYLPDSEGDTPGVANWLGNLAFFLQPVSKVMLTGRFLYVGDRNGMADGYNSVDFTLSRADLLVNGFTLMGGVKDLFDRPILYTTIRPTGLTESEYQGRTWWIRAVYDF